MSTMTRRRVSAAGLLFAAVAALLLVGTAVSVVADRAPAGPLLAGRPLARCASMGCTEADAVRVPVAYDGSLPTERVPAGFRVASIDPLPGTDAGPCRREVRRVGSDVRAALAAGSWRVVFEADGSRYGAVLESPGDPRPGLPAVSWTTGRGEATLTLSNDRGTPLEVTGTTWSVRSTPEGVRVDVQEGHAQWAPPSLRVDPAVAGPVCRGRTAHLALAGLPASARLDGEVRLPDRTLTATVTLP